MDIFCLTETWHDADSAYIGRPVYVPAASTSSTDHARVSVTTCQLTTAASSIQPTDNYAIGSAPRSGSSRLKPIGSGQSGCVVSRQTARSRTFSSLLISRRPVAQRLREGQQGAGYYVRCYIADVLCSTRRRVIPTLLRHQRRRRHLFYLPTAGRRVRLLTNSRHTSSNRSLAYLLRSSLSCLTVRWLLIAYRAHLRWHPSRRC